MSHIIIDKSLTEIVSGCPVGLTPSKDIANALASCASSSSCNAITLHIQAIVRVGGHFNVKAWSDHVKKQWQGGVGFCFAGSREASIVSVGGGVPAVVKGTLRLANRPKEIYKFKIKI